MTTVAAGRPDRFALETAIGPVRLSSSRATGCSGIRSATVPLVSPRSQVSDGCARQTMVRAPGQKASVSSRTAKGTEDASPSMVRVSGTRTGGGMSRPRPFASSSRFTAAGLNASAPMP